MVEETGTGVLIPEDKPVSISECVVPGKFKKWLISQPDTRTFQARDAGQCPLAEYVKEECGIETPWVTYFGVMDRHTGRMILFTDEDSFFWMRRFIRKVDSSQTPLTPSKAIRYLNEVVREPR